MPNNNIPKVYTLDQIETQQIHWLMYPYVAARKITLPKMP